MAVAGFVGLGNIGAPMAKCLLDNPDGLVVFDVYAGSGIDPKLKSIALGLILQETSRTLTDADVDSVIGSVVDRLAADFGARIRE